MAYLPSRLFYASSKFSHKFAWCVVDQAACSSRSKKYQRKGVPGQSLVYQLFPPDAIFLPAFMHYSIGLSRLSGELGRPPVSN